MQRLVPATSRRDDAACSLRVAARTLASVKQTRPRRSPDASLHELMIAMNYKCRVHMCARSHVSVQRGGWILFFHYASIMRPEMGIFIRGLKKTTNSPNLLLSSLACRLLVVVAGEDVFSYSCLHN